ncbi:MAG TPA: hypothetical protein PKD17_13450, partial [Cellvibrionaceae bacterium]|nr:hypothetical protein [Cellvibrionaceae bacterium]
KVELCDRKNGANYRYARQKIQTNIAVKPFISLGSTGKNAPILGFFTNFAPRMRKMEYHRYSSGFNFSFHQSLLP